MRILSKNRSHLKNNNHHVVFVKHWIFPVDPLLNCHDIRCKIVYMLIRKLFASRSDGWLRLKLILREMRFRRRDFRRRYVICDHVKTAISAVISASRINPCHECRDSCLVLRRLRYKADYVACKCARIVREALFCLYDDLKPLKIATVRFCAVLQYFYVTLFYFCIIIFYVSHDVTFHRILYHFWVKFRGNLAARRMQSRVCIYLQQPHGEVIRHYEIGTVQLKTASTVHHIILRRQKCAYQILLYSRLDCALPNQLLTTRSKSTSWSINRTVLIAVRDRMLMKQSPEIILEVLKIPMKLLRYDGITSWQLAVFQLYGRIAQVNGLVKIVQNEIFRRESYQDVPEWSRKMRNYRKPSREV